MSSSKTSPDNYNKSFPEEHMLKYKASGSSNLYTWRFQMILFLKEIYKDMSKPVQDMKVPEEWNQEYEIPQNYDKDDPVFKRNYSRHYEFKDNWSRNKGAIISTIIKTLSKESIKKITLAGKSAWETAILEEDVISVMQQIIDAHTFIATGTTSTFGEQMQSRVEFATIKLHSNENIASFNQRFNDILKSLKDKGIENEYTAKTIMFCYLKPLCSYSHKEIAYKCIDYLSVVEDEDKFPTDLLEMQRSFYNKEHTINEHTGNKVESNKFTTVNNAQIDDKGNVPNEISLPNGVKLVKDGDVYQIFSTVQSKSSKKKSTKKKKSDKEKVKEGKLPNNTTNNNNNPSTSNKNNSSSIIKNPKTKEFIQRKMKKDPTLSEKEILDSLTCNNCGGRFHIAPDCKKSEKIEKVNMATLIDDEDESQQFHGGFYTSYDVNVCKLSFKHVSMNKTGIKLLKDDDTSHKCCFNSLNLKRNNYIDTEECATKYTLDGFAGIHLWNDEKLLSNVRNVNGRVFVTGVGGIKKEIFKVGDHPLFNEVFICPENKYNIISECKARTDSGYYLRVNKDNTIKYLYNPDIKSVIPFYLERDDFHRASHIDLVKECRRMFPVMCAETYNAEMYIAAAQYYTVEQQKRAQEAIALHEALGHPSDKALSAYLQSPSSINNRVSVQDLRNARDIYGPCPNCLEGKPLPNHGRSTWDPGGKPTTPGQLLHVDIVYINKKPRLFSVDHVSGYMNLIILENKSKNCIERAMDALINHYQSSLKVVQIVSTDYEEVFKSIESHLNSRGVKMALMIPYEHERVAERYMRMVREKMRVKLRELPYTLNPEFYDYLAIDCIRLCNVVPNKHSLPFSPLEMVHGEKFNFLVDMTAPFGYPFLSTAHDSHDPTAKNEVAISLGSVKNSKGGILTYIPGRKKLINRRCVQRVPITTQIIDHMNEFANIKPDTNNPEEYLFKFIEKAEYSSQNESIITPDFKEESESELNSNTNIDNNTNVDLQGDYKDIHNKSIHDNTITTTLSNNDITSSSASNNNTNGYSNTYIPSSSDNVAMDNKNTPLSTSLTYNNNDIISNLNNEDRKSSDVVNTEVRNSPTKIKPTLKNNNISPNNNVDESGLRRSTRSNKGVPSEKLANTKYSTLNMSIYSIADFIMEQSKESTHYYNVFAADTIQIQEALKGNYAKEASEAAIKEITSLIKLKTWRYLMNVRDRTPSVHERITPSSMFLKMKYDARGEFLMWKARLVGGGHRTDHDVYEPLEKHSPTIPSDVAMLQLGQASYEKANVEVFDIPSAYLNAHLAPHKRQLMRFNKAIAEIICKVDPSAKQFLQKDGTLIVEVLRALYGFPESAKLWYEYIRDALLKGGYKQCPSEPCLFMKKTKNEWSVITIFVDDCLHTYKGVHIRDELYQCLHNAKLPEPVVQQLTPTNDISYLGINIHLKSRGELFLSQPGFIKEIFNKYKPTKQYKTPCTNDLFSRTKEELECKEFVDTTEFLSKLMKLMFLARLTRPDILLSVVGLATRSKQPNIYDMQRLERIIGYLLYTKDLGMNIKVTNTELNAYFDASWNCHPDAKGHSGIVITIGHFGFPVIFKSSKQKIVTRSSTEAELVCDFTGTDILLYARRLWLFLGYGSDKEPSDLHQDNTSTITISYMGRGSSGSNSKYMDLKYFWIKDYLDKNIIRMKYLPTDQMIADFFASPRTGAIFTDMRDVIMGYNNSSFNNKV